MSEMIIARVIGGPTINIVREGEGRDQPDVHWNVGKPAVLLDDDLKPHRVTLLDWFQPFGDPALTIYTFATTGESQP